MQCGGATAHLVDDINVRRADLSRWHDFVLVTIISAIPRPVRGIRQPRNGCSARIFHCAQLRTTPHHAVAHEVVNHVPVVMQAHSVDIQHKLQLSQLRGPRRRKQPPKSTAMSPNTSGAVVWGSNAVNTGLISKNRPLVRCQTLNTSAKFVYAVPDFGGRKHFYPTFTLFPTADH